MRLDELAAEVAKSGVRHAYGVTGSGPSLRFITSLEASGVRFLPVAHEAAAAVMAGAVHEATGVPGVAVAIKGPGLANMLPGLAANRMEGRASMSFTEAYGRDASPHRRHKRVDHAAALAPFAKAVADVPSAAGRVDVLASLAVAETPGPVHVDLCDAGRPPAVVPTPVARDVGDPVGVLRASVRPLVVVGSLARRRRWAPRLRALRVPVLTTAAARGVVDERSPFAGGVFTGDGKEVAPERPLLAGADLVVGLGLRPGEVLTPTSHGRPSVLFDEVDDGAVEAFAAEAAAVDPSGRAIEAALDALAGAAWGETDVAAARERLAATVRAAGWTPAAAFAALAEAPAHALVLDTGSFCTLGEHCWPASPERAVHGSSNARWMGLSIPTAVAVADARRGTPVVCATGDGGVRGHLAEAALAVEEDLPLLVLHMRDGVYGSVAMVDEAGPRSRRALEIRTPSWRQAFEGMGFAASEARDEASFRSLLAGWDRRTPSFVEVRYDFRACADVVRRIR